MPVYTTVEGLIAERRSFPGRYETVRQSLLKSHTHTLQANVERRDMMEGMRKLNERRRDDDGGGGGGRGTGIDDVNTSTMSGETSRKHSI